MSQMEKRKRGRPRKLDPIRADDIRSVNLTNNSSNDVHTTFEEFDNSVAHDLEEGVTLAHVDGVSHEDVLTDVVFSTMIDDGIAVDGNMHVENPHDQYPCGYNELPAAGTGSREANQTPPSLGADRQGVISETVIDTVVDKVLKRLAERERQSGQQLHSEKVGESGQKFTAKYIPLPGIRSSVVETLSQRRQASSSIYQRKRNVQTVQLGRPLQIELQSPQLDHHQNNEQELIAAKRVIAEIMAMHAALPFNRPVDPTALGISDYFEIVDTPMDFTTIYNNIESGVKYKNSGDVYKDVGHIWRSCRQYYSKGDQIMDLMELVEKNFMNLWTTAGLRKGYSAIFSSVLEAKQRVNKGLKPTTKNTVQRQQDDFTDSVPKHTKYDTVDRLQQDEGHIILDTDELSSTLHDQSEAEQSQLQLQQADRSYNEAHHPASTGEQECPSEPLTIKDISCPDPSIDSSKGGTNQVHSSELVLLDDSLEGDVGELENYAPNHIETTELQPYPLASDGDAVSSDFSSKKRRTRGPTKCLYVWNRQEDKRIYVPINKLGEPIGVKASKLSNFLGTIARDGRLVPLSYLTWKKVPAEIQENIWQLVQSKFDIDPQIRGWVFRNLATKFANWKAHLMSKHYNPHQTDEERLADCDKRVLLEQWQQLITFWNSEESQKQSERNKANRAKVKFCHTSGTKSFARLTEEQAKTRGKEPTKAELFILTRTRKDGQPVNELSSMAIAQLQERMAQLPEIIENDDIIDEILYETIGQTRRNRTRITSRSEAMTTASEIKRAADEEVSQMRQKMEQMEQKYNHMESLMNKVLSNMESNSANEQAPMLSAMASEDGSPTDQVPALENADMPTSRRYTQGRD